MEKFITFIEQTLITLVFFAFTFVAVFMFISELKMHDYGTAFAIVSIYGLAAALVTTIGKEA